MNRRKFLSYVGCGCCGFLLNSCSTTPITERRQLKIIPEAKLNAQAAAIYQKVKEKEKLSDDITSLNKIKEIGKKMEYAISEYFYRENLKDPTANFDWEYILIDNDKVKNAWCMPGGKIAVYSGMLKSTKNTNGLAAVMGHEIAHAVAKHSVERASRGTLLNVGTRIIDNSTTSGSNSYQSINPKFCEMHSLATPPSPPPIIAAFSFFEFSLNPELTNVELYKCSSLSAT